MSATQILQIAEWTIADRGKEYDSTKGERSGARVAAAFSAITGKRITAAEVCFRSILSRRVPRMHCFD